jgi:integrase
VLPSKLLDQVRQAIRAHYYSRRTEEAYVGWIRRFIVFHGKRHPAEMGESESNAFLTPLKERVSASTQNQAPSALLFLYRYVIGREVGALGQVIRARRPTRLPVVLTREEVKAVLSHLQGDRWLMASLIRSGRLTSACSRPLRSLRRSRRVSPTIGRRHHGPTEMRADFHAGIKSP